MRLGGPLFGDTSDPERWAAAARNHGYRAVYCPVSTETDDGTVRAYVQAAQSADLVIAEVGAWSNPIDSDASARRAALDHCRRQLDLAERIGARCCVNITGSRGEPWDGPHPDNLTEETFDLIVESVRAIIDAVKPTRTYYTLETMPWAYPDSPESYLRLLKAIDRNACAVHLDPVNLINSPERYYRNGDLIGDCFRILGPSIQSCHAKDILLAPRLTVHLDEVRPGAGALDYRRFLREMDRLPADTPLMLEHLPDEESYRLAAGYLRSIAREERLAL